MRGTKEMVEVMEAFEKAAKSDYADYIGREIVRIDIHGKAVEGWPKNYFYTDGEVNKLFKVFMMGYTAGRCAYMNE